MPALEPDQYAAQDRRRLRLILLLALLHGLLYVFLLPPWQHYDEPNHFEHVWLAATLERLPQPGDQDSQFNREVMESMIRNDFFRGVGYIPQLGEAGEPVKLFGYSQLDERPLYYLIASLPLRALYYLPVEGQLIVVRLVSLVFLLLSVLSAWGIARQLTDPGHPLRWMLPLTLAVLPGFVELMSAVNNDVAAIGLFSLFLWGSVSILREDVTVYHLLWVVITAILTYFIKTTAMIALLILPFVLLFAFLRGSRRKYAWGMLLVGLLVGILVGFRWGDAAFWYRGASQSQATRLKTDSAVVGDYAFFLDSRAEVVRSHLYQIVSSASGQSLGGKEVTLGGWIWSSQPVQTYTPSVSTEHASNAHPISVNQTPQFFAFSTVLPEGTGRLWVKFTPNVPQDQPVELFYDGIFLVEGSMTTQTRITYKDLQARRIGWDDSIKENLLRNGSAERPAPRLHPLIDRVGFRILPDRGRVSVILTSLYDSVGASSLYQKSLARLFRTFWGEFGWGHISLSPPQLYGMLFVLSVFGLVGFFINMLRTRHHYPWDVMLIFGLALVLSWGITLVRGAIYLELPSIYSYIPVARHAYPAIIPTLFVIVQGWIEWGNLVRRWWGHREVPRFPGAAWIANGSFVYAIFFFLLLIVSVASLRTVLTFYQSAGG